MWINKEVDLPEALVSAQRARRFVVLAGAGISMGAPSNLPDFGRLADRFQAAPWQLVVSAINAPLIIWTPPVGVDGSYPSTGKRCSSSMLPKLRSLVSRVQPD